MHYSSRRPTVFPAGEFYHICNKSIANYGIFKDSQNAQRFLTTLFYYNRVIRVTSLSEFLKTNKGYTGGNLIFQQEEAPVIKFLAYCIMPDHYHMVVKTIAENALIKYMNDIENSYTRFFNIKFHRIGPLWQSAFRVVLIESNELLLHVVRYNHLNPTTSDLVKKPEDWEFSSYRDYIYGTALQHLPEISIHDPSYYKKFCDDQIDYQKTLRKIKHLCLD